MAQELLITNCRLFDASEGEEVISVLVRDGLIAAIGRASDTCTGGNVLDAQGRILAPGFIDIHIHGAGGADVLDETPEAFETISQTCARFGTTAFVATTVFKPHQANRALTVAAEQVGRDLGGARMLGIHLEGPFISTRRKGAILPECVSPPSQQILDEILEVTRGHLKIMTIAPELPGADEVIGRLVGCGIVASFGHSAATYEQTLAGFDAGISHVTHLFNAMSAIHHRSPGPLTAIFENEQVSAQLICDGVHIHPALVKLAFGILGAERVVAITDGMQALGLGDGRYIYNGLEYKSRDGVNRYRDGALIGTALPLNRLVERLIRFTGCSLEAAIRTATENAARAIGVEQRKGCIAEGKDADLVLLEPDLSVWATMVGGKIVFRK